MSYSQKQQKELNIDDLKNHIHNTSGVQKLKLLDSLCRITRDRIELKYDSIVKVTIEYAIELDSFDIANRQAARFIWSLTNRLGRPNEGKTFFEEFDARQLPVTDNALLARFYLNGGDSYYFSEEIEKAIEIYNLASKYAIKLEDSILYGTSKKYIADAYIRTGNLVEASKILKEVEDIYIKTNDTIRLVNTKSSRADLYSMNGFYDEAKLERDEAIELAKIVHYESGLISTLLNSSIDNSNTDNHIQAIINLNLALEYAKNSDEVKNRYEPHILNKLLEEYSIADSLGKATEILKEIQRNPERYTKGIFEDEHIKGLSYYFYAKKDFPKALDYAQKHYNYQIKNNVIENIKGVHYLLYSIHEAMGNYKLALDHYEEATNINDSILSLKRSKALSYYQTLYETEKRDAEIVSKESEIEILDSKNKIKTQWMLFGGIGLLALFTILYLLRSQKYADSKQILQEQFSQDLINEQEKERTRLARELHDSVGQKLMLLSKQTKNSGDSNVENLADITLEEIRSISRGLHPSNLERLGLTESINALVYNINANTDLFFTDEIDNIDNILSKDAELHTYRIIQETLSNIVKHSEAKAVKMNISKTANTINIEVSDNGKGFDSETKYKNISLGLKTLFERAKIIGAEIYLNSQVNGGGTKVTLNIPI
ncbi:sensor histidine kinase [Psychroserpens luteolus]|uniref:sensor histidine kinase n=1 Tax=Psychroserpens luteolus TaxID=2855840 RepID=UPI001E47F462|nr:sensor histidine kinase [Psychroserpens luteolus]MCD2259452.1 sensor histidine kinase [Psychroserpens luteolus]